MRATGISLVTMFVLPPSFDVLEQRLRGRGKDSDVAIRRRLDTARIEVAAYEDYDFVVVNDDLDACVTAMRSIILAERVRCERMRRKAATILKTFGAQPVA